MRKQCAKTIPIESAEKELNGFIQEGYTIISMVSTEFGLLVVIEGEFYPHESSDKSFVRGQDLYNKHWKA